MLDDGDDVDIRPVPVDQLATFAVDALAARRERIDVLIKKYTTDVEQMMVDLAAAQRVLVFLQEEDANVILAQQLERGDVVRVVCSACNGVGMRPADVLSGQIAQRGSAFENTKGPTTHPVIDERNRCPVCKGQRWQIMQRFRG